jgi:putative flippase GtrA
MRDLAIRLFNSKAVRYLFTAGTATIVDVSIYFLAYNYLFHKANLELFNIIIGAPSLALAVSFSCGLITNFTLTKVFVFNGSNLKSSSQFGRYALVAILVFISNYYLMNFLIKVLGWYPTLSRGFSAISIGVLSFMTHKTFTFRIKE